MAATKVTKSSITQDYVGAFEGMRSYEKMRLGYVYGCLVVGFTCDGVREPQVYKPTFHLHNLAKCFPTVSLSASHTYRQKNVPITISYDRHQESFGLLVEYFRKSCPLIHSAKRSMELVFAHHAAHLASLRGTVLHANILEHEIPIYALAYFGDIAGAMKLAERTVDLLAGAPEDQAYRFGGGSKAAWLKQLESDFLKIHDTVANSIAVLNLSLVDHYKAEHDAGPNP